MPKKAGSFLASIMQFKQFLNDNQIAVAVVRFSDVCVLNFDTCFSVTTFVRNIFAFIEVF